MEMLVHSIQLQYCHIAYFLDDIQVMQRYTCSAIKSTCIHSPI